MWLAERNNRGEAVLPFFVQYSFCVVPQTELEPAAERQNRESGKSVELLDGNLGTAGGFSENLDDRQTSTICSPSLLEQRQRSSGVRLVMLPV